MVEITNAPFSLPPLALEKLSVANWLKFSTIPLKSAKITTQLNVIIRFIVELEIVDFDYLGLPDYYDHEGHCNKWVFGDQTHASYKNWRRWSP